MSLRDYITKYNLDLYDVDGKAIVIAVTSSKNNLINSQAVFVYRSLFDLSISKRKRCILSFIS